MVREAVQAALACVITFIVCAIIYPVAVWGMARAAFPKEAEGSLIRNTEGVVIGSELIAQPFASDTYFQPRPSAVDYKADATGGSNLGTKNPDLRKKVVERAEALKATKENPAPLDLISASGGGMDPHVSREAALYQIARVSSARKMSTEQVTALVERHVETSGAIIGAPARVNVLRLNLDLDAEKPAAPTTPIAVKDAPPPLTEEVGAIRGQVREISEQIRRLGEKIESSSRSEAATERTRAGIEAIERKITGIVEENRKIGRVSETVDGLEGRVKSTTDALNRLDQDLRDATTALKSRPVQSAASTPVRGTPRPTAGSRN